MDKAVLHDHLDGGLRGKTALELAKKASYKPLLDVENINNFFDRSESVSLEDYLEAFIHTTALMNTYDNLERIAFEAAEDMHNNGINLYESRYAPLYSVSSELSIINVLKAINSGFKQAETLYGIKSGLILCGMRNDKSNVEKVGEIAIDYKELIIGSVSTDNAHKDGTRTFYDYLSKLIEYQEGQIKITCPGIEMSTVDLIKKAKLPISLLYWAHSCHTANEPCMNCNGCKKYLYTLQMLGLD